MISGETIGKYISRPEQIEAEQVKNIKSLLDKHPYSSTLYLLYLKGLAIHNQLDFESVLKVTAAHTSDRGHLYTLIHSGEVVAEETVINTPEIDQNGSEFATSIEVSEEELIDATPETIAESEIEVLNEQVENPQLEENQKTAEESDNDTFDEVEIDIINAAIDSSYITATYDIEEVEELDKSEESITLLPEEDKIEQKELSFVEWLKLKQSYTESEEIKSTSSDDKEKTTSGKNKKEIDQLLEKFMKEEPRITKPVKEFYNPVEHAKKSVEEGEGLVSETLAKIHVMQKNYSKAIASYEKLILLYPEKKTFFASQIQKIREEIKNK